MKNYSEGSSYHVLVLLAAYNGEKWIQAQLDTILCQNNVKVEVLCSVDRSDDSTFDIIKDYDDPRVKCLSYGERFGGAGPNFYRLFRDADFSKYDFIALSDQDDLWLEDKLMSAIDSMKLTSSEAFSSDVVAFWDNGKRKIIKKSYPQTQLDYFFESPGPGCTYVLTLNLALGLQEFIQANKKSELIDLHDWLIYAFARNHGYKWLISEHPKLLYRQHENNQCGANSGINGIKKRLNIMKSGWYSNQVLKLFGLFEPNNSLVTRIERNSRYDRLYLCFKSRDFRRKKREKILLSIAILLRLF
ncbi:glycosyltransferase [Vibrio scophthalmi]|uniref:glycosyltransferase n=1 Tax=Vibrio scophthalmi TaxID=45658 RepID=UPI002284C4D4|nr:glycosyltransferase [Vibrio scophthalmi]MCY9804034.1 glycosyltransferase [Vibrio scophthalmi]